MKCYDCALMFIEQLLITLSLIIIMPGPWETVYSSVKPAIPAFMEL